MDIAAAMVRRVQSVVRDVRSIYRALGLQIVEFTGCSEGVKLQALSIFDNYCCDVQLRVKVVFEIICQGRTKTWNVSQSPIEAARDTAQGGRRMPETPQPERTLIPKTQT